MEGSNIWAQVGNRCLELAKQELNKETAPTAATVETVERLVRIAISVDGLNLRRESQARYAGARVSGVVPDDPQKRGRLAETIRSILADQSQAHSLRQQSCPTSPEQTQAEECRQDQPES